uniref:Eukaryotic translation initiation factor 2C, 2 [Cricetulus griseus] n=1 Tax=Lepeophtheirus salmonis TaxID=72036 RepID=A0A0K2T268_LEPSM
MGKNKRNRLKFVPLFSKQNIGADVIETQDLVIKDDDGDQILHIGSEKHQHDNESIKSRKTSSSSSGVYSSLHSSERASSTSPFPLNLTTTSLGYPNKDKDLVQVIADGMARLNYGLTRPGFNKCSGLKRIKLSVNIMEIKNIPEEVYQYKIEFKPEMTPMSIRRKVVQAFINGKGSFIFTNPDNGRLIHPAYDGNKLLFSKSRLNFPPEGDKVTGFMSFPDEHSGIDRKYSISIEFQTILDLRFLMTKLLGDPQESSSPNSIRKVVETIMRHQLSLDYVAVGLNFFQETQGRVYLGNGREAWVGYHQNVIPCNGKLGVVMDVACSAFYKEQRLIDFVAQYMNSDLETLKTRKIAADGSSSSIFQEEERRQLTNEISGLKIKTTHGNTPRLFRAINVGRLTPKLTTFDCKITEDRISVESFFKTKYGITLEYPNFPCLHVVKGGRVSYIPMELCWLVRGQRVMKKLSEQQATSMIKLMASSAPNRQRDVQRAAHSLRVTESDVVKDFGIQKEKEMMRTRGHILRPPMIEYNERNGGPIDLPVNRGSWDAHQKEFKEPKSIFYWAILNLAPTNVPHEKLISVAQSLIRQGRINGLDINPLYEYSEVPAPASKDSIDNAFVELKKKLPQITFVFIILDGRQSTYSYIKSKGDKEFGFISQCIRWKSICKGMRSQMYSNLIMKINFKLGGTNGSLSKVSKKNLKVFDSPIIVMGATLSHPHNPEPKRPSVASIVGSMDASPSQFIAYSTVQSKIHQHIVNLSEMVQSALMDFYINNGKLKPHRIIFYRDALRASLFLTITKCEVMAIRRACLALEDGYRPGITFVVIQRRHNTRLFCGQHDSNGKAGNVPAGTCLDHTITHPKHFDFYLSSHFGIQGTSRPTYYRVMWDDNRFSAEDIQNLTYSLCHCYSRCTKSVAIPAPSYYAHLAAVRTRHHIANGDLSVNFDEEGLPINEEDMERAKQILTIHENNKYKMYFT